MLDKIRGKNVLEGIRNLLRCPGLKGKEDTDCGDPNLLHSNVPKERKTNPNI